VLDLPAIDPDLRRLLAPSGVLRAGINMSNFLLVSSRDPAGGPAGVSPDMATAIAGALGLALEKKPYPSPGPLADAAVADEWDIGLIGAEPQRAETIAFTSAYAEIEATVILQAGSPIKLASDVDRPGVRIAYSPRTAWGLWLERNIKLATLVKAETYEKARELFVANGLEALGGLRPKLIEDVASLAGARVAPGRYMAVQQAIGVPNGKAAVLPWLQTFVTEAIRSGFVAKLIAEHGVSGLSVAINSD
jgi:polar amino acid transport system substrate-binding protein